MRMCDEAILTDIHQDIFQNDRPTALQQIKIRLVFWNVKPCSLVPLYQTIRPRIPE
jgi:hypothetical protein